MVRLEEVDAAVDEAMRSNHQPILKRVYIPGHNHDADIADVDFRISQLSPEGLKWNEFMEMQRALWEEKEAYEGMEDVPDTWITEAETDGSGNVVTYASAWDAADFQGKRAMLKETRITADWTEIDGVRYPAVVIVPRWVAEEKSDDDAESGDSRVSELTAEIRKQVEDISRLPYEQASAMTPDEIKAHVQQH